MPARKEAIRAQWWGLPSFLVVWRVPEVITVWIDGEMEIIVSLVDEGYELWITKIKYLWWTSGISVSGKGPFKFSNECFVASSLTFSLFPLTLLTFVSFAPHVCVCVCVTSKYSHKWRIFPSVVSSVSKTELPSVSARKYATFLVHSVKIYRKSVLYYTHTNIFVWGIVV